MSCYVVTGDFFADKLISVPKLVFTLEKKPQTCMCVGKELYPQIINYMLDSTKFTLRIICKTPETRDDAWSIQEKYQKRFRNSKMTLKHQCEMFFELQQFCDCRSGLSESIESLPNRPLSRTLTASSSSSRKWGSSRNEADVSASGTIADMAKKETKSESKSQTRTSMKGIKSKIAASIYNFRPTPFADALSEIGETKTKRIINREIVDQLRMQIDDPDNIGGKGWIYLIESPSAPGHLLIGCEEHDLPGLIATEKQCVTDVRLFKRTRRLPNIRHITRLVLAELRLRARNLDCSSCGEIHRRWFEVERDVAETVVLRWSNWMMGRPYNSYTGRLKDAWRIRLKDDRLQSLQPAAVADPDDIDKSTWGWWAGMMEMDNLNQGKAYPRIELLN